MAEWIKTNWNKGGYMSLKAKYCGECPTCGLPFWPGEPIKRKPMGWGHEDCPDINEVLEPILLRWLNEHKADKMPILRAAICFNRVPPEKAAERLVLPHWVGNALVARELNTRKARLREMVNSAAEQLLNRSLTDEERKGGSPWFTVINELEKAGWSYQEHLRELDERFLEEAVELKARAKEVLKRWAVEVANEIDCG